MDGSLLDREVPGGRSCSRAEAHAGKHHTSPPTSFPQLEVKLQVEYMSFSAHADAKGIMQLIRMAEPRNMLLVHGEAAKMEFLKGKIEQEFSECSVEPSRRAARQFNPDLPSRHRLLHASQRRDGHGDHQPQRARRHLAQPAEEGDGARRCV